MMKQKVKVIEGQEAETPVAAPSAAKALKGLREPKARSKKYLEAKSKIVRDRLYTLPEAIKIVKETSYSAFTGTMEVHLIVKKVGTSARVTLPHSAGKQKKIEVASEDTIKKLTEGKIDFDILLATADMMPKLVAFAKLLGPKGLMPNPKNGTLIKSEKDAEKFSTNTVTIKTEKSAPLIHAVFGKVDQPDTELAENLQAILAGIGKIQIVRAYIKSTMSPSVKLAL